MPLDQTSLASLHILFFLTLKKLASLVYINGIAIFIHFGTNINIFNLKNFMKLDSSWTKLHRYVWAFTIY